MRLRRRIGLVLSCFVPKATTTSKRSAWIIGTKNLKAAVGLIAIGTMAFFLAIGCLFPSLPMLDKPATQHEDLRLAFDEGRFDDLMDLAATEISLWRSVYEAAYRRERATIGAHCEQIRAHTKATFETARLLVGDGKKP